MVSGAPGAGKTTLAMQFLLDGLARGERCLYVTLSETETEIQKVARSHGWDLQDLRIKELVSSERNLSANAQLTVFNPSELELGETTEAMIAAVDEIRPHRVVLDSLSELRLVAQNSLRYRRQVLALKHFFAGRECTVLLLDDQTGGKEDDHLQSIAHGVVLLEQQANLYGAERRRLRVVKMRGVAFRGGYHDFVIRRGGLDVFPRLIAAEHITKFAEQDVPSGNAALDQLLGGGLPTGTSTLLLGPAGTGKSTIATLFAVEMAARGGRVAVFLFDENIATFRSRSRKLGLSVDGLIEKGVITVQQVDPAEMSAGEFATIVRRAAEGAGQPPAKVIVIDSLNGYLNAMPEEKF
jgi:circadian clock protein KaiC